MQKARALFNFKGEQEGDLPFTKGEVICIVKKTNTTNDWWTGVLNGRQGIFPANFVELI
ncbi:Src homology-3 [Backusella circina FSU 941]|nr:Src homology-3 [Backusella circina FSU 941]